MNPQLSSGAKGLKFGLSICLCYFFVCAKTSRILCECAGLVWILTVVYMIITKNLMYWLILSFKQVHLWERSGSVMIFSLNQQRCWTDLKAIKYCIQLYPFRECTGSMVKCLTQDRGAAGSSLTAVTALCPWARHINPSLVLVQPRKTRPYIIERLLMGC